MREGQGSLGKGGTAGQRGERGKPGSCLDAGTPTLPGRLPGGGVPSGSHAHSENTQRTDAQAEDPSPGPRTPPPAEDPRAEDPRAEGRVCESCAHLASLGPAVSLRPQSTDPGIRISLNETDMGGRGDSDCRGPPTAPARGGQDTWDPPPYTHALVAS